VLHGVDYKQIDATCPMPIAYTCQCTRERAIGSLSLFAREELVEMIEEGGTEIVCQFCGRRYEISGDEILALTATHEA
jgi:molecular chaperone Hsp33